MSAASPTAAEHAPCSSSRGTAATSTDLSAPVDADSEVEVEELVGTPPLRDASFTPVTSKSAKRRAQRRMHEHMRAAEADAHLARTFRSPQVTSASHSASSAWRSPASPTHLRFTPPPRSQSKGSMQHTESPLPALKEMFPALDPDVLSVIFESCGHNFDRVVEYMLAHDADQKRDEQQMQAALNASLVAAANEGMVVDLPPPPPIDRMSLLSGDLFALVCDHLNSFELARLGSVSRDARTQVDAGAFAHVDKVDVSRFAGWPDWRMLRMVARFPASTQLSFRNTHFQSFDELTATCFGRCIRALNLSNCDSLQDVHLHTVFDRMGEYLQLLDLSSCEYLTDDGLEHIATSRHNRALEKLLLNDCKFISSTGVARILERCTALTQLDLKGTNVTRTILSFTQQQSRLTSLNLSSCKRLSGEFSITSPFCQLRTLTLSSNLSLKSVTLSIPTLTSLNCSNSKYLHTLSLYTPLLRVLQLNGCLVLASITTIPHQSKQLLTRLEEANFNLCRSITALSFHYLLTSALDTLRLLSCRGCLLLSDANIALLMPPEPASRGYSMLESSSAAAAAGAEAVTLLEWVDLSGCKGASPSTLVLATRAVADANARRTLAHTQQHRAGSLPWAAFVQGMPGDDSGGLDNDDIQPLD